VVSNLNTFVSQARCKEPKHSKLHALQDLQKPQNSDTKTKQAPCPTFFGFVNVADVGATENEVFCSKRGTVVDKYCPGAGATAACLNGLSENRSACASETKPSPPRTQD
jgi:hypothetical protein